MVAPNFNEAAVRDSLNLEVEYIHETGNIELFQKAYDQIFAKIWPEYVDLDTPEEMLNNSDSDIKKFLMVVGKNLADPDKCEVLGFRYAFYFPRSQTATLVYLAVDPDARGQGIGHEMVDLTNTGLEQMALKNGKSLNGIFFEIDDPSKTTNASGGLDPFARKKLFEGWGAEQLPVTYVRPDFKPDGSWEMDQKYLLMGYPHKGNMPSDAATLEFLIDVHSYLTGNSDLYELRNSPEIQGMKREMEQRNLEAIEYTTNSY